MPATAPSFVNPYDKTLDELEERRLAQQRAIVETVGSRDEAPPPTRTIHLEYEEAPGVERTASLVVRVLSHDEMFRAGVYASQLAGVNLAALPAYMQELALGRAFIAVMWGKQLPDWLKKVVEVDEEVVFSLFEQIQEHRRSFFRRNDGASEPGAKKPGLRIHQSRPAGSAAE